MTTERRDLAEKIRVVLAKGGDHYDVADAVLAAFPQIALPQDVVEGAKAVVDAWETDIIAQPADLAEAIAAFATAHAEREREREREGVREICDAAESALAASAAVREGGNG